MSFAIINLGCKVNRVESDGFARAFEGLRLGPAVTTDASLVVVNTCTVTGEAEKKARKAVRRALKEHPRACVVVTGCAAALDSETFTEMGVRVTVVGKLALSEAARTRESLTALVGTLSFDEMGAADGQCGQEAIGTDVSLRVGQGYPTRVGIKVQDGCDNACTYCIVHVARGKAWSRPKTDVLEEFHRYVSAGVHEVILTGINLGSYSDGQDDLCGLLEQMLDVAEGVRLRISSIEPRDVDDRLVDLLARSEGRIARHLHLPLQSGNSRILRQMARPYGAERFAEIVERLYKAVPNLSLSTDIIVGFPGETEGEFEDTLAMARACRFSKIHVFPYSRREGTPAAQRADQVDPQVKADRVRRLSALGDLLRTEAYEQRRGTYEDVLVETDGKGMTESYFEIEVSADYLPGELVTLRLP